MKNYRIHFIRHGKTAGNIEIRLCGSIDMDISPQGREELQLLEQNFRYPYAQKLYCSPLKRCIHTADILYKDIPREILQDLREFSFGDDEGKQYKKLTDNPEFRKWVNGQSDYTFPNGDNNESFANRCRNAVEHIVKDVTTNKIEHSIVMTHGGVIMNILSMFGVPRRNMSEWLVENGRGYTVLLSAAMWMRDEVFEVFRPIPELPENQE